MISRGRQTIAAWQLKRQLDRRAQHVTIRSAALGIRKHLFVYTPPGFGYQNRLPALYLFRGHEHEWVNPGQDQSRGGQTVIDVYEDLLSEGAVGPMRLVFPGISSDDNTIPGMLVNFRAPAARPHPGLGSGRFEDYFLRELIPVVDTQLGSDPSARGLDGFSLGGFMAVKIAAQYPHLFRSVGAFDGLYFWDDEQDRHSIAQHDQTFRNPIFDPVFGAGDDRDRRYAAAHNPLNLVRNGDANALARLTWLIEYGPETSEPGDSNFYRGDRLCALLAEKQIANRGRGELTTYGHSWKCADEHMRYVLPMHWEALSR